MTQDRQKLEDERQQQREEVWEKRYLVLVYEDMRVERHVDIFD